MEPIALDSALAARAGELAAVHGLRGSDGVHRASFERAASAGSVLVAADDGPARTAESLGYAVAIPG